MTWLEIALIVSNVVTIAYIGLRLKGAQESRKRWMDSSSENFRLAWHRYHALMIQAASLNYYAAEQSWQSPSRGKHSDAFRDRGERAREALEAARKILEEGK